MLRAGSQASFLPSNLALWDNYGLSVGTPLAPCYSRGLDRIGSHLWMIISCLFPPAHAVHSLCYELTSSREGRERSARVSNGRTLLLFVFLEAEGRGEGRRGVCEEWLDGFSLVQELRSRFDGLVMDQSRKFQQAVHSALNRLICNYSTYTKVSECVLLMTLLAFSTLLHVHR